MRVCSGMESEGQLDDGYNWRKYGQKDILGAAHPRLDTEFVVFLIIAKHDLFFGGKKI